MTRDQATAECARLAREDPRRQSDSWIPRQMENGDWEVMRVAGVPSPTDVRGSEMAGDERPPTPEDPRQAIDKNVRYLNP